MPGCGTVQRVASPEWRRLAAAPTPRAVSIDPGHSHREYQHLPQLSQPALQPPAKNGVPSVLSMPAAARSPHQRRRASDNKRPANVAPGYGEVAVRPTGYRTKPAAGRARRQSGRTFPDRGSSRPLSLLVACLRRRGRKIHALNPLACLVTKAGRRGASVQTDGE